MRAVAVEPRPSPRVASWVPFTNQCAFLRRRSMRTIRRAAAVLIYPAILCLGVACERTEAPTNSPPARGPRADLTASTPNTDWLARALSLGELLSDDPRMTAWTDEPMTDPITVVPFEFDPGRTHLVRARWLRGTGCPTNATTFDGSTSTSFSDPACNALAGGGDPKDSPGKNEGLLLVKTGPTTNDAAAGADLKGVKGITLTELGYDIRAGTHCGAGAPRFNVVTSGGILHFLGCASPPPIVPALPPSVLSPSWQRLRWGPAELLLAFPPITPTDVVTSISIVFDEGQDTPFASGLALLDNIDVNGTLVGRGPGN